MIVKKFQERSYAEQQVREKRLAILLIFLPAFLSALFAILVTILVYKNNWSYWWVLISMVIAVVAALIFNKVVDKKSYELFPHYKGAVGEDEVEKRLKSLSDDYIYISNYLIPNLDRGDIDALLIGPKGVIALEIKNLSGEFEIKDGQLYIKRWNNFVLYYMPREISKLVERINYFEKYLKRIEHDINVHGVFVFAGNNRFKTIGSTGAWVTRLCDLLKHINDMPTDPKFTSEFCQALAGALMAGKK